MNKVKKYKLDKIESWFRQFKGTITAFSGGVDSALVLYLSRTYLGKEKTIGVISASESLKDKDYKLAVDFCKTHDIKLLTIKTDEIDDPSYNSNPWNRCYYCKTHLYIDLNKIAIQYPGFVIINGNNKDDYDDFRPGHKASDEHGIRSPLAELKIGKDEVRRLAKSFNLGNWDKPASPCLSSRIPYGEVVTVSKLKQIEKAEAILNNYGFYEVRVRHYGQDCKIEVPKKDINQLNSSFQTINSEIHKLGFKNCLIDIDGLESGKLNKSLNLGNGQS